jgi:hypothetical protein
MAIAAKSAHGRLASCAGWRASRTSGRPHHRRPRKPGTFEGGRVFFSGRMPQQMERLRAVDWLAGAAMLLAAACWGVLVSLLGS